VVDANNTSLAAASQKVSSYTYTAADKLTTETDPAGNTTSYTYDKVGNRLSMTDPRGNSGKYSGDFTIVYEYDALNRLVKGYLPKTDEQTEKPQVKLVYDARGNLAQRTEPDGLVITYTYAPRNRLQTETRTGAGKSYVITHSYDGVGNEIKVTDARGYTTVKEYDAFNRLAKVTYPEQEGQAVEQYG
jgi:YD repeat-containing protein